MSVSFSFSFASFASPALHSSAARNKDVPLFMAPEWVALLKECVRCKRFLCTILVLIILGSWAALPKDTFYNLVILHSNTRQ